MNDINDNKKPANMAKIHTLACTVHTGLHSLSIRLACTQRIHNSLNSYAMKVEQHRQCIMNYEWINAKCMYAATICE